MDLGECCTSRGMGPACNASPIHIGPKASACCPFCLSLFVEHNQCMGIVATDSQSLVLDTILQKRAQVTPRAMDLSPVEMAAI